jgi:methionine-gamma-lyase
LGFQTDCTATGEDRQRYHGSISPPIYASSLFTAPSYAEFRRAYSAPLEDDAAFIYSRVSNPTLRVLEQKLALLEHGEDCRVFGSGMAAIAAAILSAARVGDHVLAVRSIYATAYRLISGYLPRLGIETSFADFRDLDAIAAAIRPNTRVLYVESPGNPAMHIVELPGVAELARRHGLVTIIDNTLATPFNSRPLELGMDLVVHSATKYLSGHSDVVAGALIGPRDRMRAIATTELHDLGGILGPFEAWLILRGVRTLGLRMAAHNAAAMRIAGWLEGRPEVERVLYPGLPSHSQHALAARQMSGFSGMISLVVRGGFPAAARLVDRLRLFGIGVSWGGFESLALPIDAEMTAFAGELDIVPGFVRLAVGLEDVEDLLADLEQALKGIAHG